MNKTERQMTEILMKGREKYGVVSVKAEFEAEGTRTDELLRLVDISRSAGLPITVKIGGCEAIRDLLEAKQIGVGFVVAPMVETSYALEKYISAKNLVFGPDERSDTQFLFNIETHTGFSNRKDMLESARTSDGVDGIVFGRVDFVGSLRRSRETINDDDVTQSILEVASDVLSQGLDLVVGGGVSIEALPSLIEVARVHLTRFETRKVVFSSQALNMSDISEGLLEAVHFELLWLMNKRDYYGRITQEDARRIEMLESRWKVLNRRLT